MNQVFVHKRKKEKRLSVAGYFGSSVAKQIIKNYKLLTDSLIKD